MTAETLLNAVNRYLKEGRSLAPVLGKRAYVQGWPAHEFSEEELLAELQKRATGVACKLGVPLHGIGGAIYHLDVDTKAENVIDMDFLRQLNREGVCNVIRGRPERVRVEFRLQEVGLPTLFASPLEFRGKGTLGVLPPSVHPDTQEPYRWLGKYWKPADLRPLSLEELVEILERLLIDEKARGALLSRLRASLQPKDEEKSVEESNDDLVMLLRPYWIEGRRHMLALAIAATARRAGMTEEDAKRLIESIARACGDTEVNDRVRAVKTTYSRPFEEISAVRFFAAAFETTVNPETGEIEDPKVRELWRRVKEALRPHLDVKGLFVPLRYELVILDGELAKREPVAGVIVRHDGTFISVSRKTIKEDPDAGKIHILVRRTQEKVFSVPVFVRARYSTPYGYLYAIRAGSFELIGTPEDLLRQLQRYALVLDRRRAPDVLNALLNAYNGPTTEAPPAVGVFAKDERIHVHLPEKGPIAPPLPNTYANEVFNTLKERGTDPTPEAVAAWRKLVENSPNKLRTLFVFAGTLVNTLAYALNSPIRPIIALVGEKGAGKTAEALNAVVGLLGGLGFSPDTVASESRVATMFSASTVPFVLDEAHKLPSGVINLLKAVSTAPRALRSFRKRTTQEVQEILPLSVPILTLNEGGEWLEADLAFTRGRVILVPYRRPSDVTTVQRLALLSERVREGPAIGWAVLKKYDGVPVADLKARAFEIATKLAERVQFSDARRAFFYALAWLLLQDLCEVLGVASPSLEDYVGFVAQLERTSPVVASLGDLSEYLALLVEKAPPQKDGVLIVTSSVLRSVNEEAAKARLRTFSSLKRLALAVSSAYGLPLDEIGPKTIKTTEGAVWGVRIPISLISPPSDAQNTRTPLENEGTGILAAIRQAFRELGPEAVKRDVFEYVRRWGFEKEEFEQAWRSLTTNGALEPVKVDSITGETLYRLVRPVQAPCGGGGGGR